MKIEQLWETLLSNMYDCTSYNDMPISLIIHEFKKCDDGDYIFRATGESGLVGPEDELLLDGVVPVEVVSVSLFDEDGELSEEEDDICERGEECIIRVTPESNVDEDSIFYIAEECSDVEDLFDCDSYLQDIEELTGIEIDKEELLEGAVDIFSIVFNTFSILQNEEVEDEDEEYNTSTSNNFTGHENTIIKTNNMEIDKNEIQYVVGIDLGHGETSAALCSLQWDLPESQWEAPIDIEMGNNRKVMPSAITLLPDGRAFIGDKAFDPEILKQANAYVCFKQKPVEMDGERERLMIRFMSEVYKLIRENTSGILNDSNHVVFIATPSGWDATSQDIYKQMAKKAGIPIYGVTKESRAAYIRGMHSPASGLSQNVRKGAIVFDMGSSTLDFTYLSDSFSRPIDFGYDCGASHIEKFIYDQKRKEDGVREFEERYPDLLACLLYEARNVKEQVYFNPGMKVKKNIHLDEIIEDDDLDVTVKFLYQPNELNEQLEKEGYLKQIENAMCDFMSNHINNAPIYGVFLTGGASRMDFIIPLVSKTFKVPKQAVYRDQDPSLTISQGVAEVARMDLHTQGADVGFGDMINNIKRDNRVYKTFVSNFSNDLWRKVTDDLGNIVCNFKDADESISLNDLTSVLEQTAQESVNEFLGNASSYAQQALLTETEELTNKISALVAVYTQQGVNVKMPTLNINLNVTIQPQAITSIINTISKEMAKSMKNTTRMWLTGAGAVFGLLGIAAGWLIGSLFNDSDEEKMEKAMKKGLNREQRLSVFKEIEKNWQNICDEIGSAINTAISQNTQIENTITKEVNALLNSYANEFTQAKMIIE